MGGFSSLATAVSGLNAAQTGLYVTGHNMANSGITGYSRQRALQNDFLYNNIGSSPLGALKIGLGTDVSSISQIRDKYLDMSYRQESSRLGYYSAVAATGIEIETILGELHSEYTTQSVIHGLYEAMNELMAYPQGLETRAEFVERSIIFLDKMNTAYDDLLKYQNNLDGQIRAMAKRINELVSNIEDMNRQITSSMSSGDHPNDLMDKRNNYLDELSLYLDIDYSPGKNGRIDIITEGRELLADGFQTMIGLQYISGDYPFVQPILTTSRDDTILSADAYSIPLYKNSTSISADMQNDKGQLKGLFYTRGLYPANYTDTTLNPTPPAVVAKPNPADYSTAVAYAVDKKKYDDYLIDYKKYQNDQQRRNNLDNFYIPSVMAEMDCIFNKIVTMINDAVAPRNMYDVGDPPTLNNNAPYNNFRIAGTDPDLWDPIEIFKRKNYDRFDATGKYNGEDNGYYSLYTIGNVVLNPALLNDDGGKNRIALSRSGDINDPDLVTDLLDRWKSAENGNGVSFDGGEKLNINTAYNRFITRTGTRTDEARRYVDSQNGLVNKINNDRMTISGVSLDEEMKNMMTYQHAYNAAARVINAVDSMIDKIVNGTGRVGR